VALSEDVAVGSGVAGEGTGVEVGGGSDGSKVGEADDVEVEARIVGVKVGRGIAVEPGITVGVGEENLTGNKVEVGRSVALELTAGKSARPQASRKMVKTNRAGNRDIAC
jgi:hypothetical protein